jgi:histidine triad (HIT) family protein
MRDCVFCAIAADPSSAVLLHEDAEVYVALDIAPIRRGHSLVVTRQHVETFELLPDALAGKIVLLGQRLARRLKAVYGVERVAFLFAGHDVPHVHAHVIPMHEKTDVTSARYQVVPQQVEVSSAHLSADRKTLLRVREEIGAFA